MPMRISASESPPPGAYRGQLNPESGHSPRQELGRRAGSLGDAHFKLGQMSQARTHYARAQEDSRFKDYVAHQIEEIDRAAQQR